MKTTLIIYPMFTHEVKLLAPVRKPGIESYHIDLTPKCVLFNVSQTIIRT